MIVIRAIKTKGLINLFFRIVRVISRVGLTSKKMKRRILKYASILKELGVPATFPLTAKLLSKHSDFFKRLSREYNIELAMHGYAHIDYTKLSPEEQARHIEKALFLFKRAGIAIFGFRAPYLRINNDLVSNLENYKFEYDSSSYKLYNASKNIVKAVRKTYDQNKIKIKLPSIPVALADDEILIDRLGIKKLDVTKIWISMLKQAIKSKEIFVLQLHPERIDELTPSLVALVNFAKSKKIPILMLEDVVRTRHKGAALCITGDIDRLCLLDFIHDLVLKCM